MVRPSCPALLIHDDDAFRRKLIATLDEQNFSVTFCEDGAQALEHLETRSFAVVIVGVNLSSGRGLQSLEHLRAHREAFRCGVVLLGDPDPNIRTFAPWAHETLLKPVDPQYVAARARTYCDCD